MSFVAVDGFSQSLCCHFCCAGSRAPARADIISMDLLLPVSNPGGIPFQDNKGLYLALVLGQPAWFPACAAPCATDCFQVTPAAPAEHLPAPCPSCARIPFFPPKLPFLRLGKASAPCRLLGSPVLALFFAAIPPHSFHLRYCCRKIFLWGRVPWKNT